MMFLTKPTWLTLATMSLMLIAVAADASNASQRRRLRQWSNIFKLKWGWKNPFRSRSSKRNRDLQKLATTELKKARKALPKKSRTQTSWSYDPSQHEIDQVYAENGISDLKQAPNTVEQVFKQNGITAPAPRRTPRPARRARKQTLEQTMANARDVVQTSRNVVQASKARRGHKRMVDTTRRREAQKLWRKADALMRSKVTPTLTRIGKALNAFKKELRVTCRDQGKRTNVRGIIKKHYAVFQKSKRVLSRDIKNATSVESCLPIEAKITKAKRVCIQYMVSQHQQLNKMFAELNSPLTKKQMRVLRKLINPDPANHTPFRFVNEAKDLGNLQ